MTCKKVKIMIFNLRNEYDNILTKKENLITEIKNDKKQILKTQKDILVHEKARKIISKISEQTQNRIKIKIEEVITLAIQSVFDEPFVFELQFQQKRNRIEAVPVIKIGNEEFDPKDELGGAIIDIISFVFRIVLWGVAAEKTRPIFILDEPFRFTGSLVVKAGEMVKFLSKELKLQIIIVSHDARLIDFCDQVYKVTKRNKKSHIKLVKEYIKKHRQIKRRCNEKIN